MATNTTNYGWTKPSYEDAADIEVINGTIDNIDAQVKANDDKSNSALVELVDGGAKNHINNTLTSGTTPFGNISYTVNKDKSITIKGGTATANADIVIPFSVNTSGTYVLTGGAVGGGSATYKAQIALYPSMANVVALFDNTYTETALLTGTDYAFRFRVYPGQTVPDCTIYPMICTKADWDISQSYQPYAMGNAELTQSVEPIPRLVDAGAKNKLLIGSPTSIPAGLTCVRNSDGTYKVSGTLTSANSISFNIGAIDGDLVLSGCPEGGGNDTYLLRITKSGSQVTGSVDTGNGSDVFTMDGTGYALNIRFAAGTYTNVIFSPMVCTKAEWDISQQYVPYRPSYQELYERVVALENA